MHGPVKLGKLRAVFAMDQLPRSSESYGNLFPDNQYHAYSNDLFNGADQNFNDPSWSLNSGNNFSTQSRAQPALPTTWQGNANHLPTAAANGNGQTPQYAYARGLSNSPAPFQHNPYGAFPQQQQPYQQSSYDPALFNQTTSAPGFNGSYVQYNAPPHHIGTIAPHALQQQQQVRATPTPPNHYAGVNYTQNAFQQQRLATRPATSVPVNQHALAATIPKGQNAGLFSNVGFDEMARATNSERMGGYVNIGRQPLEWPVNRPTTLPSYVPRKSKNELRKLAGNDASLLAKIGKKAIKKERLMGVNFNGTKGPGGEQIKYEGDTSSSEESSDDEDDSSYTSEDEPAGSPLPSKRPEDIKAAVEYDTIKALWRPKRKSLSGDQIKKGMGDFWEVIKTIRDRWKADAAILTQAEEKQKAGELPLLKSRVKDQRDMMEMALKAALKHGHRSIVELMGENASLIFVCYQFLLDRFKAEDLNGQLSRAVLELLSIFTTLSNATLEKTHLVKVLPRYVKMGDARTAGYAKRITANAANASKDKEKTATAPPQKPGPSASPPTKRPEPEPVAGIKRPASTAGDGSVQKKMATGVTKSNGASSALKPNGANTGKKPVSASEPTKAAAASTTPATKTKQVTAKPTNFFSSLQSAKKPGTSIKSGTPAQAAGTKPAEKKAPASAPMASSAAPKSTFSFAETMANLQKPKEEKPAAKPEKEMPPETPEQKAKRLRKEARRKLHVRFADSEDLVQIRYFTHDPDEEFGHDDSQMRDVSDAGGEGRALKLHQDQMDVDEEEEEEVDQPLIDFKEPHGIDFSDIDQEDRQRNYAKFGGELEPESSERTSREQYEANTLMVFYTDEKDIPPTPVEPADAHTGPHNLESKDFGAPEPKWAERARKRQPAGQQPYLNQQQAQPAFNLAQFMQQQQPQPPPVQTQGQQPQMDISALLANLQQILPQQQQQAQAASTMNFGAPPTQEPQQSQQSSGVPDLSAILAAMNNQNSAPQNGLGVGPVMNFQSQPQQQQQQQYQNKRERDQGDKSKYFKTKVCKYWQEGRCMKGDGCTYLHEEPSGS